MWEDEHKAMRRRHLSQKPWAFSRNFHKAPFRGHRFCHNVDSEKSVILCARTRSFSSPFAPLPLLSQSLVVAAHRARRLECSPSLAAVEFAGRVDLALLAVALGVEVVSRRRVRGLGDVLLVWDRGVRFWYTRYKGEKKRRNRKGTRSERH